MGVYIQNVQKVVDQEWRTTKDKEFAVLHKEDLAVAPPQHHFLLITVQKFTFVAILGSTGTIASGLVVSVTSNSIYQAQFDNVWVHTHGQVAKFIGFAATSCLTAVYTITFFMTFTYEVKVFTAVSEQLEWLALKCSVTGQLLKLRHFNEYQVETNITRATWKAFNLQQRGVLFLNCTLASDIRRGCAFFMVSEQLDWLAFKCSFPYQFLNNERRQLVTRLGFEVRKVLTRVVLGIVATGLLMCIRGRYNYLVVQQIEGLFGLQNNPFTWRSYKP